MHVCVCVCGEGGGVEPLCVGWSLCLGGRSPRLRPQGSWSRQEGVGSPAEQLQCWAWWPEGLAQGPADSWEAAALLCGVAELPAGLCPVSSSGWFWVCRVLPGELSGAPAWPFLSCCVWGDGVAVRRVPGLAPLPGRNRGGGEWCCQPGVWGPTLARSLAALPCPPGCPLPALSSSCPSFQVNVTVDYIRPASSATDTAPAFSERTCATVTIGGM